MSNRFRPVPENQQQPAPTSTFGYGGVVYPLHKTLAIYGRQSTKNQVENNRESYEAQTQGLLQRAVQVGWKEENIIIYVENIRADGSIRNASGRLRIDQREGLNALIERIQSKVNILGTMFLQPSSSNSSSNKPLWLQSKHNYSLLGHK